MMNCSGHKVSHFTYLLSFIYLLLIWRTRAESECPQKLDNCTQMVRPYLDDIRYMFPTNLEDVDVMCRMWGQFVDCVRKYVSQCFSEERKILFHKSVENSVDTVHAICSSELYQREYLSNAVCFKRISIESCGQYYKQLIEHVSNPRAHDDHICCSYGQFKNCVNDPLLRECGRRARGLMDHSMGFLISRCSHSNPNGMTERCPDPMSSSPPMSTTTTATEEPFDDQNDVSNRARADRSFDASEATTTESWTPRTVIYTLPPEPGSQTSAAHPLSNLTLFIIFFIPYIVFIFSKTIFN